MSKMAKVKNPNTGKVEVHTIQNANDLTQHLGWEFISLVKVNDGYPTEAQTAQDVLNNSKKIAKYSTGSDNAGEAEGDDEGDGTKLPVEDMTPAEIAALNNAPAPKSDAGETKSEDA